MIDILRQTYGYVPKRALRYFLEGEEEKLASLVSAATETLSKPETIPEDGTDLPFYAIMILAALHRQEGKGLIQQAARLNLDQIDILIGAHLFQSLPIAIAELYRDSVEELRTLILDATAESSIRAASVQAMMTLFGNQKVDREELVPLLRTLLETRSEKIPYLYDVAASAAVSIHPGELIDLLRNTHKEGFIDSEEITLEEIEEFNALTQDEILPRSRQAFAADLSNLIGHLQRAQQGDLLFERNDPCPCESGLKYKKCCQ